MSLLKGSFGVLSPCIMGFSVLPSISWSAEVTAKFNIIAKQLETLISICGCKCKQEE